jgi:hypothetical protein
LVWIPAQIVRVSQGEGRFLFARLSEQIRRFERDDAVASRLYTIVAGG